MDHVIEVKNLQKHFQNVKALDDVNFQVKKGEIFGLLGPSGAGKTTTIKVLTGELGIGKGDVQVLGMNSSSFGTSQFKSQIGISSDNSALYERLTVFDNLKFFCKLYNTPLDQIDAMLEIVNLTGARNKVVSKLSKGMKQRVLLAKSLLHNPRLVFLDEPTSSLDPHNVIYIHEGLRKLNEAGTTIFLTTHNMEEATELCDRVAFLNNGRIEEIGEPDDLRYKYSTHEIHIETFSGENMILENKPENAEKISQLITAGHVKNMHIDNPTLGEVFLEVTGKGLV